MRLQQAAEAHRADLARQQQLIEEVERSRQEQAALLAQIRLLQDRIAVQGVGGGNRGR